MIPLSIHDRNLIVQQEWLTDDHMDRFIEILHRKHNYKMQGPWKIQHPELIEEQPLNQKYIQILHSCENFATNEGGHWICLYYDAKSIYIYDSLQVNKLHRHHVTYIKHLFPSYAINNDSINFVHLKQKQPNGFDCGVYAIAYATSLCFGLKPENMIFNHGFMRRHLLKMFDDNLLQPFPVVLHKDLKEPFIQARIQSKVQVSSKKREQHMSGDKVINEHNAIIINHNKNKLIQDQLLFQEKARLRKQKQRIKEKSQQQQFMINNKSYSTSNVTGGIKTNNEHSQQILERNTVDKLKNLEAVSQQCIQLSSVTAPKVISSNLVSTNKSDSVINRTDGTDMCITNMPHENNRKKSPQERIYCKELATSKNQKQHKSADKVVNGHDLITNSHNKNNIIERLLFKENARLRKKKQHAKEKTQQQLITNNHDILMAEKKQRHTILKRSKCIADCPIPHKRTNVIFHEVNTTQISDDIVNNKIITSVQHKRLYSVNNSDLKTDQKTKKARVVLQKKKIVNEVSKDISATIKKQKIHNESNSVGKRAKDCEQSYIQLLKEKLRNSYSISIRQKLHRTKRILKKYNTASVKSDRIETVNGREKYVNTLSCILSKQLSRVESRLEAERIIKWCFYMRNQLIWKMKKLLQSMKEKAEISLTLSAACSDREISDKINALCGLARKHTSFTEPYFLETAYVQPFSIKDSLVMNANGKCTNILPLDNLLKGITWNCSVFCKVPDDSLLEKYKNFLRAIHLCTVRNIQKVFTKIIKCTNNYCDTKLGHSHACYVFPNACASTFISVEFLSPHFPQVRIIKRIFYKIYNLRRRIVYIDSCLNSTDLEALQKLAAQASENTMLFKNTHEILLNEDEITRVHIEAFKNLNKHSMDVPRYVCISCEKLQCRKRVREINKLRNPPAHQIWKDLIKSIKDKNVPCTYICDYCLSKLRLGKLPPTCILNKLDTPVIPEVISQLNDYERILIQRAKAFQTIVKMDTVAKKNLPWKVLNTKVKGSTFHLPLPLEKTIQRICPEFDAINRNHELYILVRGIPTKAKKVWESLVDIKKVFNALSWLKKNNTLYSNIKMPTSAEKLFDLELEDTEFTLSNEESFVEEDTNKPKEKDVINLSGDGSHINDEERALVTQMSQSDSYYEQFTIHPMLANKENKSATELYQMLKIHSLPLKSYDTQLDLKCFPDLYPYGINGQHEERAVHLSSFEFIKTKLMSIHSQFRLNHQYLFYLLHDSNMRQLNSSIYHKLKVTDARFRYTAADCLQKLQIGELEQNLCTIFGRLRNTEQYWKKPRGDVNCMMRHYGPPTWFLTLSPAEWCWTKLIEYLRELNPHLAKKSANELIAADPVLTSRFIDNEFQAMLKFLCSDSQPIGKVTHYFWRREYQGRGIQHFHMILWIKDAPVLGTASKEDVVGFLEKYITCKIPNKSESPTLHRRVITHQHHRHNSYCLRTKDMAPKNKDKSNTISHKKVCRFAFPKPITSDWIIRDVETSIASRRKLKSIGNLYDNPRTPDEVYINNYNPTVLAAWEGNMDISFIGEKSGALASYITKYMMKNEKAYIGDLFDQINSTKSLHSRLWNIGLRALSNRECGVLEAADTLLGNALYGTDPETSIKWIDVNIIRNRRLKPHKTIEKMSDESTDIFFPGLVDYYYPRRPKELDQLSLYDFAKWYEIVKVKPVGYDQEHYKLDNVYLKKRKRGYLINHYIYDCKTQPENYFHALLLLFQPWRNEDELKNGFSTYVESFSSVEQHITIAAQYHERLIDIMEKRDEMKELVEKRIKAMDDELESTPQVNEVIREGNEAKEAMKDFKEIGDKHNEVDVTEMVKELNADQKRVFDNVTMAVNSHRILRLYISGEGGTGKSFLIKTLRQWMRKVANQDTAVIAPTGIAAFNIDGLTIHRLLQLPVEHDNIPKYKELSDAALKVIRDQMKDVGLIIIDEVSMISNITLLYIHMRLTEIFDTNNIDDGWFGKRHILLFGDLFQLPPVRAEPAFVPLKRSVVEKLVGCLGTIDLWTNLFSYDELRINMRQKNDALYGEILSRMRLGFITNDDLLILESRKIIFKTTEMGDRIKELCDYIKKLPDDTVCLLSTTHMCNTLNDAMLDQLPSKKIDLIASDILDCAPSLRNKTIKYLNKNEDDTTQTAGLAKILTIKIGAKVMLRRNIDVSIGLVNGTIGTVVGTSQSLDNSGVETVKVVLPNGMQYDIEKVSVKFEVINGAYIIRNQFPLCLSYALTIHKSQGLSLKNAVIDAGNSIFNCGQTYVALSRVTTLEGLHLINFDPRSVLANPLCILEYNRLRKCYRPDLEMISVCDQQMPKIKDDVWIVPKAVLQCQITEHNNCSETNNVGMKGFQNINESSSCANSVMQCIFHCKSIVKSIVKIVDEKDVLTELLLDYLTLSRSCLTTMRIQENVEKVYGNKDKNDASAFFATLCSMFNYIERVVQFSVIYKFRCNSCGYVITSEPKFNNVLILTVPESKEVLCLQDIIDYNFSKWDKATDDCKNCDGSDRRVQSTVTMVNEVFVIQIDSKKNEGKNKIKVNNGIKSVPSAKVFVCGKIFKVVSAIFYHNSKNNCREHYTCMLKSGNSTWIHIHDSIINKKNWPRNSKDRYMFFLENIPTNK